jgi:hypothetical protein
MSEEEGIEFWKKEVTLKPWERLYESLDNLKKVIVELDETNLPNAIAVLHTFILDMDFCFTSTFQNSFSDDEEVKKALNEIKDLLNEYEAEKKRINASKASKLEIIKKIQKKFEEILKRSAEFHRKFDVHLPFSRKESWELTTLDRLQIKPDEKVIEKINEKKKRRQRLAMIIALDMVVNDQDQQIVIAGENGMGKSTTAIWLAREIKKDLIELYNDPRFKEDFDKKRKFINENELFRNLNVKEDIIFRRDPENVKKLYNYPQYGVKVIDEGYFFAMNIESMTKPVVDLIKIMNMSRDRNGCIIWVFKKFLRATPSLRERFTLLIYKATRSTGLLVVPSRMVVSGDKFGGYILEREANRGEFWFKRAFKTLPWYVTSIQFPAIKGKGWEIYLKLKRKAEEDEIRSLGGKKEEVDPFIEEIDRLITKYHWSWDAIARKLIEEEKFTLEQVEGYKKQYSNYLIQKKKKEFLRKIEKEVKTKENQKQITQL